MVLYYTRALSSSSGIELRCFLIMLLAIFVINTPVSYLKRDKQNDIAFQLQTINDTLIQRKHHIESLNSLRSTQLAKQYFESPLAFDDLIDNLLAGQNLISDIHIVSTNPSSSYRHQGLIHSFNPFFASPQNSHSSQAFIEPSKLSYTQFSPLYANTQHIGYLVVEVALDEFAKSTRNNILLVGPSGFVYASSAPSHRSSSSINNTEVALWEQLSRSRRYTGMLENSDDYFIYRKVEMLNDSTAYLIKVVDKTEFIPKYFYLILGLITLASGCGYYLYKFRREHQALSKISYQDELSGLYNRHYLRKLEQRSTLRHQSYVGIFDIDHFKQVNDKYGHDIGDQVIKRVAQAIKVRIRDSDYAFRFGGEEFVVIIHTDSKSIAAQIFERIRTDIASMNQAPNVTISGGFSPVVSSLPQSLKQADQMLYKAKQGGRNKLEAYCDKAA
ncbi:GGDEF domain-containing protein [Vibrio sp. SCSIO 43135]|uniref:GGDEF domain-containing protein n=1 Tax=Vibrio sp. SCSIO 43135 TaxID=2819096 RepID=UPI0020750152|nr:GGDEF domain-containing protein [Vibrio sp. SCSIO 43135]